jgi:hypothetical protein
MEQLPEFYSNMSWFLENRQDLVQQCCHLVEQGDQRVFVLAIVDQQQMKGMLERVIDSAEFLSDYGLRSLSKFHEARPFAFGNSIVSYEPGEADCKIKGGNSNWRGPIWFPTSFLMIESLRALGKAYGPTFTVPGPDGRSLALRDIAGELANRMIRMFTRDGDGRRAIYGDSERFQTDPHWRDHILFFEYFHGDHGAGLGASHQTGWSALVASLIDEWRR